MNQLCKVCDERAAGFHFGAFTCEGCKSFFGRSYNNMSSITPCKNNERCVINKKNRTSCKACRLKKCLKVGMSKGGSRYGRRSNWFKLHLLTEQDKNKRCVSPTFHRPNSWPMDFLGVPHFEPRIPLLPSQNSPGPHTRFDDCKHSVSPAISSPESHNSESSVEIGERHSKFFAPDITRDFQNPYALQAYSSIQFILQNPAFLPPPLPPSNLFFSPSIVTQRVGPAVTAPDADPKRVCHDGVPEAFRKRLHLDAILRSQLSPPIEDRPPTADDHYPIDLRVQSAPSREEEDEHITVDDDCSLPESHPRKLTTPLDLSTKGWKCTELASA